MEVAAQWLEAHMLSCPGKAAFGVDCPGCGLQSAFADLIRGDLAGSWAHHPALIPLLLTFLALLIALTTRFRYRLQVLKALFVTTALTVLVNYALKMI